MDVALPPFDIDILCSRNGLDESIAEFQLLDKDGRERVCITCDYSCSVEQEEVWKYGTAVALETLRMKIEKKWHSKDMSDQTRKACHVWLLEAGVPSVFPVHEWYTKHKFTEYQMSRFCDLLFSANPFCIYASPRIIAMYNTLDAASKSRVDEAFEQICETDPVHQKAFPTCASCQQFIDSVTDEDWRSRGM